MLRFRVPLVACAWLGLTCGAHAHVEYRAAVTVVPGISAQDASDIAAGDIDGDGDIDLVVVNRGGSSAVGDGSVAILRNDGNGVFTAAAADVLIVGTRPAAIVLADFDNDNDLDAAVVILGEDRVQILLNVAGRFVPGVSVDVEDAPEFIAVGDLNGTGGPDLVVTNKESDSITVLLNNGLGGFLVPTGGSYDATVPAQRTAPQGVALADLDGDDVLDAVVALLDQDAFAIFTGFGDGTFDPAFEIIDIGSSAPGDADPRGVFTADLDHDGDDDLVIANSAADTVSVFLSDLAQGSGDLIAAGEFAAGNDPRDVAIADLDGDGILDLAVANFEGDVVSVLIGVGNGTFESPQTFRTASGPFAVVAANLDGSDQLDLATANQESDTVSVLLAGAEPSTPPTDIGGGIAVPECASGGCGPLGLSSSMVTMLGIAVMKRETKRRRDGETK
jgi:hypothetical protein